MVQVHPGPPKITSIYAGISNFAIRRIHPRKAVCQKFAKNPGEPIQTHARCSAPSLSPPSLVLEVYAQQQDPLARSRVQTPVFTQVGIYPSGKRHFHRLRVFRPSGLLPSLPVILPQSGVEDCRHRIAFHKRTWHYRFMCRAAQISERHGGEEQAKRGEWVKRYGCCR